MARTTSESIQSRLSCVAPVCLNCSRACRIRQRTAASSCGMCRWDDCLRWRISPTCVCIWPVTRASLSTGLIWFWTEESVFSFVPVFAVLSCVLPALLYMLVHDCPSCHELLHRSIPYSIWNHRSRDNLSSPSSPIHQALESRSRL